MALNGDTAFVIRFPLRHFFSEIEIQDPVGRCMGRVRRRFSVVNCLYTVTGKRPTEKYEIRRLGHDCGLISSRWAGLGRELFLRAGSFGITFPPGISPDLKAVFLGAVLLIDFERSDDTHGAND